MFWNAVAAFHAVEDVDPVIAYFEPSSEFADLDYEDVGDPYVVWTYVEDEVFVGDADDVFSSVAVMR